MAVISHYNIQRAIDIFGYVQDRDFGGVARDINRIVAKTRRNLPRGVPVVCARPNRDHAESFQGLLGGFLLAIVLVYLLIVMNFQSWLDPFIIITALPAALAGIVFFLFVTRTTSAFPR